MHQLGSLEHGKEVHGSIIRSEVQSDVFVGNVPIDMYVKCGRIEDASKVFDKMPDQNLFSWNEQNGCKDEILKLSCKIKWMGFEHDKFTFPSFLTASANLTYLDKDKKVHEDIIRKEIHFYVFVGSALLHMSIPSHFL